MKKNFMDKFMNVLLVVEVILALFIGYRMVNSIGWDGNAYTYHTDKSGYLLTTEYDVHWRAGDVTYSNIPEFKDAMVLFVRDGII